MTTSYSKIIQAIQAFADQHLQIKRVHFDFAEQMPNFATKNEQYPILYIAPASTQFDENVNIFTLTAYSFDIIEKDRANINTIISDTNQILNDLYRWFKEDSVEGIDLMEFTFATPINNALLDYAAGWQMSLVLVVDPYPVCAIPLDEFIS